MKPLIYIIAIFLFLCLIFLKFYYSSSKINWNRPIYVVDVKRQRFLWCYLCREGKNKTIVWSPYYRKRIKVKYNRELKRYEY